MGPNATSLLSLEVGEFCQKGKGCGSLSIGSINKIK
jgi:hypothetical protein